MSRVVVVGSGAREHALTHALARQHDVVAVPGNDGMAAEGLAVADASVSSLAPDLVVVGPEQPLVDGLADALREEGIPVVGPGRRGARLEGSKVFLKEFLAEAGVPTAGFHVCATEAEAEAALALMRPPYVVKTDGLAAGKGVLVTDDLAEARADVRAKLSGEAFGDAGRRIVIEEGLAGVECSLLVLCDGRDVVPLAPAQDFKRVGDGDRGANTGGMGAYAPNAYDPTSCETAIETIVRPTLEVLRARGIDYRGVLYAGLMIGERGPMLLEYNVRFGDPEAQSLVGLYDDWGDLLTRTATGELVGVVARPRGASVTVVLAAHGYPSFPRRGDVIEGLGPDGQLVDPVEGVTVYHAGTRRRRDGRFETAGGRVLSVSAVGESVSQARERAYLGVARLAFDGMVWRRDIAAGIA